MNTFFIAGMFERLLREWMGYRGVINSITNLRMKVFNTVGDTVTFSGTVSALDNDSRTVVIEMRSATGNGETVTAEATITLPA